MKMKSLMFMMLFATMLALVGEAYAEDRKVTVSAEDADKPMVFPAPKAGENLTIEVIVPVPAFPKKKVAPAATAAPSTLVVVNEDSGLSLRGGLGASYFMDSRGGLAATGDLVGQVGWKSSRWRTRGRLGFGAGRYDTAAVSASLALMWHVVPQLGVGVGIDGVATVDNGSHPREVWKEQFYGASLRTSVEVHGFLLEWVLASAGVYSSQAPGDTPEKFGMITTANLTYLWGR